MLAAAVCVASSAAAEGEESDDPTDAYRWDLPQRGDGNLTQDDVGPVQEEWNLLGRAVNAGKRVLARGGLRFDVDLAVFDQYANRVISGKQNFGDFAWRVLGDWQLFDLKDSGRFSAISRGYVG